MVSTLEQMQVPNGTGPGVRRSKRPLLASRTRCSFYGNLQNLVIRSKSVIKSSSVISSQIGVMSDQLRVSLYKKCTWSCPRMSCNIWERETS